MNILIVDDEPMIREWFQMTVERTRGEYRIAGEASNGEEALAFCLSHPVDLVVTDIKMPGMNGIDLIKALKEKLPHIRSVVFSSYSEFQFAAEALKFGASEYILKAEITLAGLEEILQKIKRDIDLDHRAASEMNALRYRLNESQLTLRNVYFRELLAGSNEAAHGFKEQMERLQIYLSEKHLSLLAVGIIHSKDKGAALRIQEESLLQNAVINILDETLQHELGNGCSFFYRSNLYIMLCNSSHTGMKSQRESLLVLASRASEHLKKFIGASAVIGISHVYSKLAYLPEQLSEALEAADRHLFYGEPSITWYEDSGIAGGSFNSNGWTEAFQSYLESGLTSQAGQFLEQLMDEVETGKLLSAKQARALVLELIYIAINRGRTVGVPVEKLEELYIDAHVEVQRYETFYELSGWAKETLRRIKERISAQSPKYGEAVERACEYIAMHYAEDMLLQDIADHVHLSRTYISELFKKETGMNYNEYLMQVRMEKAKELLKKSGHKVADAASLVGYSNTSYFIKLFKSYTGLSPAEYSEQHRRI